MSEHLTLLALPTVMERTKLSKAGIYAGMVAGRFPRARKIGRRSLWVESEIDSWIDALPKMGQNMGSHRPKRQPIESKAIVA